MASSLYSQQLETTTPHAFYRRYESDDALAQYCDAHYGADNFGVPNFPAQLARLCIRKHGAEKPGRALELGCAVGRASFELATHFFQVIAVDLSSLFIDFARRLQHKGAGRYQLVDEGQIISDHRVCLRQLNLFDTARRVEFFHQNAQQLDQRFASFDLILAANLIDRLPDPPAFLAQIHRWLTPGGVLALASPYNWREHFTPQNKWLGGMFRSGSPVTSLQGLQKQLGRHFSLLDQPQDVEYVLRETRRTYQHGISELTFWQYQR
jgi:putative 4-mercaptohistidine N1-methyltranferase